MEKDSLTWRCFSVTTPHDTIVWTNNASHKALKLIRFSEPCDMLQDLCEQRQQPKQKF